MSILDLLNGNSSISYVTKYERQGYNFTSYQLMTFPLKLQNLPFELNSLEPYLSKETLYYHYHKHHQTYIDKLNELIKMTYLNKPNLRLSDLLTKKTLKEFPDIYNNAAQIWNHTFYWNCITPESTEIPSKLIKTINDNFGSYENFKKQFIWKAKSHFGSGWIWLVKNLNTNKLEIIDTHDAYQPLTNGEYLPLLVLDVWEHAYYIDNKNDKNTYIDNWFKIINWDFVNRNLNTSNRLK